MIGDMHDAARRLAFAGGLLARIGVPPSASVLNWCSSGLMARLASSPVVEHRQVATALKNATEAGDTTATLALVSTAGCRPDRRAEKIVSHRYRFLWICNPKVASRSLIRAIRSADPGATLVRNRTIDDLFAQRPVLQRYLTVAFVRHPVTRVCSFYADKHLLALHDRKAYRWFVEPWYGLRLGMAFEEFCQWLATPAGSDVFADRHWLSQHIQIGTQNGRFPDFVGRWETIDRDWRELTNQVGMPYHPLPRLNARVPSAPVPDLAGTPDITSLLRRRYAEDCRLWGYVT